DVQGGSLRRVTETERGAEHGIVDGGHDALDVLARVAQRLELRPGVVDVDVAVEAARDRLPDSGGGEGSGGAETRLECQLRRIPHGRLDRREHVPDGLLSVPRRGGKLCPDLDE